MFGARICGGLDAPLIDDVSYAALARTVRFVFCFCFCFLWSPLRTRAPAYTRCSQRGLTHTVSFSFCFCFCFCFFFIWIPLRTRAPAYTRCFQRGLHYARGRPLIHDALNAASLTRSAVFLFFFFLVSIVHVGARLQTTFSTRPPSHCPLFFVLLFSFVMYSVTVYAAPLSTILSTRPSLPHSPCFYSDPQ
jgi:hypothetical protein